WLPLAFARGTWSRMLSLDDLSIIHHSPYVSDEAVSATRHCLYELLTFALTQRFSKQRDSLGQASFLYEGVRPETVHQFFFFKQAAGALYECEEHIECLWGERDGLSVAKEETFTRVKAESIELE